MFYTDCPNCLQDALVKNYDNNIIVCLFCCSKFSIEEIADYGSELDVTTCPKCKNTALNSFWHSERIYEFNCIWCDYNDMRRV